MLSSQKAFEIERKGWALGDAWDGGKRERSERMWVLHSLVVNWRKGNRDLGGRSVESLLSRECVARAVLWEWWQCAGPQWERAKDKGRWKTVTHKQPWNEDATKQGSFMLMYIYKNVPLVGLVCYIFLFFSFSATPPLAPCTFNGVCEHPKSNILLCFLGRSYWCSPRVPQNPISTAVRVLSIKQLIIYACPC